MDIQDTRDIRDAVIPEGAWFKSTRSNDTSDCVETAMVEGAGVAVRDSKDPQGPQLRFTSQAWTEFLADVKGGKYDL